MKMSDTAQFYSWACFQGKHGTASSFWYFSISLAISFLISTIVNQLGGLWTPQHAVLWTSYLESWGLDGIKALVMDACSAFLHWSHHVKYSSSCPGYVVLGGDLMESGDCFLTSAVVWVWRVIFFFPPFSSRSISVSSVMHLASCDSL